MQYPIYYVLMEKCGLQWLDREWVDMRAHYHEHGTFYNTLQIRLEAWYFATVCVIYMSLFLFACTILDLYLVMKNPFANNEKRVKIMIGVSIV